MEKPTIYICETKGADQLRGSAFVFATRIVQCRFYLTPKFPASSLLLCLYSPVCVGPVWKPHCWFSHETAQIKCICTKQTCQTCLPKHGSLAYSHNSQNDSAKTKIGSGGTKSNFLITITHVSTGKYASF